jgi:hypothetical protein
LSYLFNAAGGRVLGHLVGWTIGGIGGIETGPGDVFIALAFGHALGELFSNIEDRLDNALWGNLDTLQDHFDRHGSDSGATDPIDYAEKAREFFNNNVGSVPTKIDANGTIRMYDPASDTFGSYNADGSTKTFYQPDPAAHGYPTNMDYWNSQKGSAPWASP